MANSENLIKRRKYAINYKGQIKSLNFSEKLTISSS